MTSQVTQLRVRRVELATRANLAAAHASTPQPHRELLIVSAHADGDVETAIGWGECSALNTVGYTHESTTTAWHALTSNEPTTCDAHPMASAAVRMALLDHRLRSNGISLAEHLGTAGQSAPTGAVVGLGSVRHRRDQIASLASDGFRRIKLKVDLSTTTNDVCAVIKDFDTIEFHLDANGSLDNTSFPALLEWAQAGVTAIEQPFAPGQFALSAKLMEQSSLTVIADEGAARLDDVARLAQQGAAHAIAIKPPRAGGIEAAAQMTQAARALGLGAAIGGMIESGLGRHVLAAFAPRPEFTVVGDLSPASRWLAEDPFDDLRVVQGRIAAPDCIGIAGDPDLELLDRLTTQSTIVSLRAVDWTHKPE